MGKIKINRLTNANIYMDGNNLLGRAEEIQLPQIKHKMADHKALGMIGSASQMFVAIESEAETEGIIGNGYLAGEIKNLITPLPYVESAENTTTSSGGADIEDDNSLRERIKQAPEKFSNAGSKGAYKYWTATAHQDIIDVAVLNPTAGVVKVYPLTKSGNPTTEILTLVEDILTDEEIRPLTDQVIVEPPEKIDFVIQGSVTLYNFADADSVMAEINSKLDEYIKNLKSKLGKDIVPTQIIAILNSIYGVYKVDLTSPLFTEIDEFQWANCTGYNINIAGYTNG